MEDDLVSHAWRKAAEDLGIEVVAPFLVELPNGESRQFLALVKGFGTSSGTLVDALRYSFADAFREDDEIAKRLGLSFSLVNPEAYADYDREHFIETLLDWGWADRDNGPPDWYQQQTGWRNKTAD
jgi:hypothetical protein